MQEKKTDFVSSSLSHDTVSSVMAILSLVPGESNVFISSLAQDQLLDGALYGGITHVVVMPWDEMWPQPAYPAQMDYFLFPGSECCWSYGSFKKYSEHMCEWVGKYAHSSENKIVFTDCSGGCAGATLLALVFMILYRGIAFDFADSAVKQCRMSNQRFIAPFFMRWLSKMENNGVVPFHESDEEALERRRAMRWVIMSHPVIKHDGPLETTVARFRALKTENSMKKDENERALTTKHLKIT